MAEMQSKMNQASQMMAASTAAAAASASPNAVSAMATVTAARQSGAMINFAPVVEVDLLVMLPSGVPVPVTIAAPVQPIQLAALQPGRQVTVSLDPAQPATTTSIDWARVA